MEIQNFINGPIFNDTILRLRNKAKADAKQVFSDLFTETKENISSVTSNLPENFSIDNGINSAVILGHLDLQNTEQKQSSGSMSTINITDEELEGWHNGKLPEGWRFTGAGGVIFSGGRKAYNDYFNVYYTADMEYDYEFGVFYDENSTEDNPVVYLRQIATSTTSLHYSDFDSSKTIKVEINKIDPSNATYEEMIALAGYIYRDDELAASEASIAVDMAREYMQADGLDWQNGPHDYTSYYLPEVVRRNKEYNPELSEAADILLDYLKDYPRGSDETNAKFINKAKENARQTLDEFIADNGVKSTFFPGRLNSQGTQQEQNINAVTLMDLSKGVPAGLVKTNAGGYIYTGDGRKTATQTPYGTVYSTNRDIEYKLITYYDPNSSEYEPIMYIYKKADQAPNDELIKIEVNKINPSNATYEEMLALAGYIYRDDPKAARDAADAVDMARDYIELDGFDAQNGFYDYTGYLHEVVRRNKDYPNPANKILAEAAENLLEYLKDYPRGSDETNA